LADSHRFQKTTERLGTDPLGKLLFRLSLPSIISMVAISLYNLVNTFWVAKLGYQPVAALTSVMPFMIVCMAIGVGTGIGVNALSSRRFGEGQKEEANRATGQTFFLCVIMGIILILVTNIFPRQILMISGATPDILDLGESYLRIIGFGMPMYLFSIISRNIFQASGDAVRPMIFILVAQLINATLDPFLIFGWGFFPAMGVRGAALATDIASGFGASLALWYLFSGKTVYRLHSHHFLPHLKTIGGIARVGVPSLLMEVTGGVGFAVFNHVASQYGSIVLAATGIAGRITDLAFMPVVGMAHGLLPIVGFSLGARLWGRLWGAVKLASVWLVLLMLIATIFLEVFTTQVVSLFNSDPALLAVAVPGMRIFCSTIPIIGPLVIFFTTFQGLSKGLISMLLSLCHQFLFFVPGLLIFSHWWGLNGVWISMPVSDILGTTVASLWIFHEYRSRRKSISP
jgi:putative MATE family efflux protein